LDAWLKAVSADAPVAVAVGRDDVGNGGWFGGAKRSLLSCVGRPRFLIARRWRTTSKTFVRRFGESPSLTHDVMPVWIFANGRPGGL